jgi:hypothetical protein
VRAEKLILRRQFRNTDCYDAGSAGALDALQIAPDGPEFSLLGIELLGNRLLVIRDRGGEIFSFGGCSSGFTLLGSAVIVCYSSVSKRNRAALSSAAGSDGSGSARLIRSNDSMKPTARRMAAGTVGRWNLSTILARKLYARCGSHPRCLPPPQCSEAFLALHVQASG